MTGLVFLLEKPTAFSSTYWHLEVLGSHSEPASHKYVEIVARIWVLNLTQIPFYFSILCIFLCLIFLTGLIFILTISLYLCMPPKIFVKQKRNKEESNRGRKGKRLIRCMVIKIRFLGFHFLHFQAEIITKVQI